MAGETGTYGEHRFIRQVGVFKWVSRSAMLFTRKRLLKIDTRLRLPSGATIILPRRSASASEVYVTNADIDWGSEAVFARFAAAGRDFLDIGAHIGYYSVYLSPSVRRAYAFEPDPRNLEDLHANARLAGNVDVVEAAVSSRDGSARLHVGHGSAVSSLEGAGEGIEVKTVTIDSFVASRPGIDVGLIKTDVEGHDLEALRGMGEVVARCQPLILTECPYTTQLDELCRKWRYQTYAFTRDRRTLTARFQKMSSEDLRDQWYKMLFLVPSHFDPEFARLASRTGVAGNRS
jgi:FkbM family methyltransferase